MGTCGTSPRGATPDLIGGSLEGRRQPSRLSPTWHSTSRNRQVRFRLADSSFEAYLLVRTSVNTALRSIRATPAHRCPHRQAALTMQAVKRATTSILYIAGSENRPRSMSESRPGVPQFVFSGIHILFTQSGAILRRATRGRESRIGFAMAGRVPAIHVFLLERFEDVDARDKRGHDDPTVWQHL